MLEPTDISLLAAYHTLGADFYRNASERGELRNSLHLRQKDHYMRFSGRKSGLILGGLLRVVGGPGTVL